LLDIQSQARSCLPSPQFWIKAWKKTRTWAFFEVRMIRFYPITYGYTLCKGRRREIFVSQIQKGGSKNFFSFETVFKEHAFAVSPICYLDYFNLSGEGKKKL
jgi:hypothetical protein